MSGRVAQLGERTVRIRKVEGSIPFVSTIQSSVNLLFMQIYRTFLIFCFGMRTVRMYIVM